MFSLRSEADGICRICTSPRTCARCTTCMRVGGDDEELRPWHYIYVYSIESRLIMCVRYGCAGVSRLIMRRKPKQEVCAVVGLSVLVTFRPPHGSWHQLPCAVRGGLACSGTRCRCGDNRDCGSVWCHQSNPIEMCVHRVDTRTWNQVVPGPREFPKLIVVVGV